MTENYSKPTIDEAGSLAEVTLRNKVFGTPNDGDYLFGSLSLTTS